MVRVSEIGSQTIISFQTKYPTYTGASFDKTMLDLKFQRNSTQGQSGQAQYFYTKENITVDEDPLKNIINFRFLNTVNISKLYDDVKKALLGLKIDPNSIQIMALDCKTMVHEIGNPEKNLTSLISNTAKEQIEKSLNIKPSVFSLVLVNQDPIEEDLQIRIEPLASNRAESFFIHINYKTKQHEKFDSFIGQFGVSKIEDIAKRVCVRIMQQEIKREIQESMQPHVHSNLRYLSGLELSKHNKENLEAISNSRSSLLVADNIEKDLDFFSKKAMKSIWE